MARSPQTLSVDDRRIVASWAADCAEHVLTIFENAVPDDGRVRAAIDQTRSFAAGELDVAVEKRVSLLGKRRHQRQGQRPTRPNKQPPSHT